MKKPIWISHELARAVHDRQLAEHGGASGIRNEDGFLSALMRPQNHFAYGEGDFAILAASYAHGISLNHPFVDGNKRTALVVCRTFLRLNGYDFIATRDEKYAIFYGLSAGRISEQDLADWIRSKMIRI